MNNFERISYQNDEIKTDDQISKSNGLEAITADELMQTHEELIEFTTQEAKTKKQTVVTKLKYVKTKIVENGKYSGAWPSTRELPKIQRRDTSCPMTLVKERMN